MIKEAGITIHPSSPPDFVGEEGRMGEMLRLCEEEHAVVSVLRFLGAAPREPGAEGDPLGEIEKIE
jgi:hypothetical protein